MKNHLKNNIRGANIVTALFCFCSILLYYPHAMYQVHTFQYSTTTKNDLTATTKYIRERE